MAKRPVRMVSLPADSVMSLYAKAHPGEATLQICVNTRSSALGIDALGCGTLQVVIR